MAFFRQRTALQLEILALRHQFGVLQRSVKRPKLTSADRFLWAWLSAAWADWQPSSIINQPGDGDRLASQGLWPVLDLEDSARKAGATGCPGGCSIFDSYDEPGQPALGRTADSRRTAQAWHCPRRDERQQVHGSPSQAASPWTTSSCSAKRACPVTCKVSWTTIIGAGRTWDWRRTPQFLAPSNRRTWRMARKLDLSETAGDNPWRRR